MKEEWRELAEINLSKAEKLISNMEKLSLPTIKSCANVVLKAMNNTASYFKNMEVNIDRDLLLIRDNNYSKSMEEFIETYFLIKKLNTKKLQKLGHNRLVVSDWKNNLIVDKKEMLYLIKKISYLKERLFKLSEM